MNSRIAALLDMDSTDRAPVREQKREERESAAAHKVQAARRREFGAVRLANPTANRPPHTAH